jgi:hypothetical protein
MDFDVDKVNEAALDLAKVFSIENGITLSDRDLKLIEWGVSCGSLATMRSIQDNFHVYNK